MKDNKYIVFTAIGFELVGLILTAVYIGQELDKRFDLRGLGIVGMSMLVLVGWIAHIIIIAKRIERTNKDNNTE